MTVHCFIISLTGGQIRNESSMVIWPDFDNFQKIRKKKVLNFYLFFSLRNEARVEVINFLYIVIKTINCETKKNI